MIFFGEEAYPGLEWGRWPLGWNDIVARAAVFVQPQAFTLVQPRLAS